MERLGDTDEAYLSSHVFTQTPGAGFVAWINDKESAEEYYRVNDPAIHEFRQILYAREKYANFSKGSLLIYRHDLWHRGTPLAVEGSTRIVLNLSFRRQDAPWFQHWAHGWARSMYSEDQDLEKIVAKASVKQRSVLGFPKPGDIYWTEETLRAVNLRYSCFGFDSTPYAEKMQQISRTA